MSFNKDTGMYEGYIYLVTNNINGKQYIGQTNRTIQKRWRQHSLEYKKYNFYFYNAIKKYGIENFDIKELECVACVSKEELTYMLNELEKSYITKYGTYENGYNSTIGGDSLGETSKIAIDLYLTDGTFVCSFDSIVEASQRYDICSSDICFNCCGKLLKLKNKYVFRYKGEPFDKYPINKKIPYKPVHQFDNNGQYIKTYRTTGIAQKELGLSNTCLITEAIREKHKCAGFYWSYNINEDFENCDRQVVQYDFDGNKLNVFSNLVDATNYMVEQYEKDYHSVYNSLNHTLLHKRKTCYGFVWRYIDEKFDYVKKIKKQPIVKEVIPVTAYYKDGKLYKEYDDISIASKEMCVEPFRIRNVCEGIYLTFNNLVWRYSKDSFDSLRVKTNTKKKPVICTTTNEVFESITEAQSFYGSIDIWGCCNGYKKRAGTLPDGTPLVWEYAS